LNTDPSARRALAEELVGALADRVPGSSSGLRGSLANASDDAFSDVDLFWEVPDAHFEPAIDALWDVLERVGPVSMLRFDPLLQNSRKRRLVFVQFAHVPLFWRVDIEISAESIARDPAYDLDNADARGDDWSLTESALMNAVAALKYQLRGDPERAEDSIRNAYDRIAEPVPDGSVVDAVGALVEWVGRFDLELAEFVHRVQLLEEEARRTLSAPASGSDG
jgi:hypothetical protein